MIRCLKTNEYFYKKLTVLLKEKPNKNNKANEQINALYGLITNQTKLWVKENIFVWSIISSTSH